MPATFDLKELHGAQIVAQVLKLFDQHLLENGSIILLPNLYRIRYSDQNRVDLYREAIEVQSYCIN